MIAGTDTDFAPWITIRSNDKSGRGSTRCAYFLSQFDYEGKDPRGPLPSRTR